MTQHSAEIIVIGAGVFGLTAALELRQRGHQVILLDPGPLPHPLAASTDINKVVRVEYGADEQYMLMGMAAIEGWRRWNSAWQDEVYHETGVLWLSQSPLAAGGFEYESYQLLLKHGWPIERLNAAQLAQRFPAFRVESSADGFFNPHEGYAESSRTMRYLIGEAEQAGVKLYPNVPVAEILREAKRAIGVRSADGTSYFADTVIVAAGAWSPILVPELAESITTTGQPVFHLKPRQPERFTPPHFTVFGADLSQSGWYGMPLHPREGVVKLGFHNPIRHTHPVHDERVVTEDEIAHLRQFLADSIPALADAELVYTRLCLYTNTPDEDFYIGRVPFLENLLLATGGSGHGFKFAPILGGLIADATEGRANEWLPRFAWRNV